MRNGTDPRSKRWSWIAHLSGASVAFVLEAGIVAVLILIAWVFALLALAVF